MSVTLPQFIEPMLAVSGRPFDSTEHFFEPKWDGVRCIFRYGDSPQLLSRSGRDISLQFPELEGRNILQASNYILDGEIICLNEEGKPAFNLVRKRILLRNASRIQRMSDQHTAIYVAFDLLYFRERPLFDLPFERRRSLLEKVWARQDNTLLSPAVRGTGNALFAAVTEQELEGIVAKDRRSPYLPGKRSYHWVKVRRTAIETFWIIGFSQGDGRLRSLALGERRGSALVYVGHVGSGLNEKERSKLLVQLKRRLVDARDPIVASGARETDWVLPQLRCRVEYLERTETGILRHPVFRGLVHPGISTEEGSDDKENHHG